MSCCLEHLHLPKRLVNNIRFFYPLIVFVSGFRDCWDYLKKYSLPYHPLHDQGFPSIGDVQTTLPVPREKWFEYAGERSGRFQVSVLHHSPIIRIAEILSEKLVTWQLSCMQANMHEAAQIKIYSVMTCIAVACGWVGSSIKLMSKWCFWLKIALPVSGILNSGSNEC